METKIAIARKAEQVANEYIKKIYGFTLKRTSTLQDAEDLAQEISLKVYKSLLINDEIENIDAYIWRIANNVLANYYRSKSRSFIGINIDDLSECIENDDKSPEENMIEADIISHLKTEIAYLSKIQRQIIILYYYSGKKQYEIAALLKIPKGTVKWHLFEAKAELKKGMGNMRNISDLKFNPVKFGLMGTNGSIGSMGSTDNFFRDALSQNIAYCVYRESRTINEIADILGVSPVYIESEVEFLEEYGFLIKKPGNRYIANILIDEADEEVLELQREMYEKAIKLISNEIFDELFQSDILNSDAIYYPDGDKNFLMWTLAFYVLAYSDTEDDNTISFEEAATIRKDGAQNIAYASIDDVSRSIPKYYENMKKWCGPMWNGTENLVLWQINTEWSDRKNAVDYPQHIGRDLSLLERFIKGETLSKDEYAFMVEKGYIKGSAGSFLLGIVWIKDADTKSKLLEIGTKIRMKYYKELKELKDNYTKCVLSNTPKHLQKVQAFGMQYIFKSDGWFLLYSAMEFLKNGRLKLVDEKQRKFLTTLISTN